jgi:hypothetical protein
LPRLPPPAGIDAERLVKDAALRLLEGDAGFRDACIALARQT